MILVFVAVTYTLQEVSRVDGDGQPVGVPIMVGDQAPAGRAKCPFCNYYVDAKTVGQHVRHACAGFDVTK